MALQTESPTVNRAEAGSIKFARKESIMLETEEKVDEQVEEKTETTEETTEKATEEKTEEKTGSMERIKEEQAKTKTAEEAAALATQNAQIAIANTPKKDAKEPFDIYKHVGLDPEDPEDVPTQAQLKQINAYNKQQNDLQIEQMQFLATHPDFNEIVGTQDNLVAGKFAPPLAKAIKENPALIRVIMGSNNYREAAYQIAKPYFDATKAAKKTDKDDKGAAADAIAEAVANAGKVKSSSNVAGGGVLSEEGRIASLSEKDFLELARANGATV